MLVLSRKRSQRIVIGDDITIEIVEIGYGKVRLAIEAPAGVKILRAELEEKDEQDQGNSGKQ